MKQSVLIRIIAWSVTALLLTAILIGGITETFPIYAFNIGTTFHYQDSGKYTIATDTVNAGEVNDIAVNWLSGTVRIQAYDGNDVIFSETSQKPLSENSKMRYYIHDGKLTIQFCASRQIFPQLDNLSKELTLQVPYGHPLAKLDVESVSGAVEVSELSATEMDVESMSGAIRLSGIISEEIDLQTVSGSLTLENTSAHNLSLESVSGKMSAVGTFDNVNCEAVSGSISLAPGGGIVTLDAETVSGNLKVTLPADIAGFKVNHSSLSGDVQCDFPIEFGKKDFVYQNGYAIFNIDTVSGSLNIIKQ